MSRVGKKPIIIPENVTITLEGQHVLVKGPKGELTLDVNPWVSVTMESTEQGKRLVVSIKNQDEKKECALWGTTRALLSNLIVGVTEGFKKELEVNGVGFRIALSGSKLTLNVGYSHPVLFELPKGVTGIVENNIITLSGNDSQLVGETAARIRKVRKPEPYKGKGIKYVHEVIRRKAGKAAKAD